MPEILERRRRLLASLLVCAAIFFGLTELRGSVANVYISQSGAGAVTGATCGNAQTLAFFNNGANWGSGGSQIGPDTVVHACGTFTGSAGQQNFIVFQGSGTSGHPITLLFESGAIVQAPYFSNFNNTGHAINTGGKSWLVIDGGANGIVQNTANGTALANHQASVLVGIPGGGNVVVKNLSIINVYVHTNGDGSGGSSWGLMTRGGTNLTVGPNNTFTQADLGFFDEYDGGESNLVITGNHFNGVNQDIQMGPTTVGATFTNIRVDHNDATNWVNWDEAGNGYHHNFVHMFTNVVSASMTGTLQIYDNVSGGDMGDHATSMIYLENNNGGSGGTMGPWQIFNNTFDKTNTGAPTSSGIVAAYSTNGLFANNVIRDADTTGQYVSFHLYGGATGWTVKNNIFQHGGYMVYDESSATNFNNNVYYNSSGGTPWIFGATFEGSFSAWKTACGCDAASVTTNPLLDGTMHVGATSPAIGLGQNLTSLGIGVLDQDLAGSARPGSGAWDAGAFNAGAAAPQISITITPNPLSLGSVNVLATASATATVTNTSTSATLVLANPFYAITGPQAPEFTRTSGSCGNGTSLAAAATCTIAIQFAPTSASPPARAAVLTVNTTTSGVSASINLSGTAVAPGVAPFTFSPTSLSFGAFDVGVQSGQLTATVTNPNAATTIVSTIALSGTNAADFAVTGVDCVAGTTSLPTGQHCTVGLKFTPGNSGARSATLTVSGTGGVTGTLALSGTGNAPTGLPGDLPGPALKMFARGFHDSSPSPLRYFLAREVFDSQRNHRLRGRLHLLAHRQDESGRKGILDWRFLRRREPEFLACGERDSVRRLYRLGLTIRLCAAPRPRRRVTA